MTVGRTELSKNTACVFCKFVPKSAVVKSRLQFDIFFFVFLYLSKLSDGHEKRLNSHFAALFDFFLCVVVFVCFAQFFL